MQVERCHKVEVAPEWGAWRRLDHTLGTERWRAVTCFSLFLTFLLCFAPGGMSPDTVWQYKEALDGVFYNWHPPIMVAVWRLLFFFQQGPLPMLCFQLLMLFGACWLLSGLGVKKGEAQWYWLFLPLLPQVYCVTGMIWKDVEQAFAFFLAFALYARSVEEKSTARLLLALLSPVMVSWCGIIPSLRFLRPYSCLPSGIVSIRSSLQKPFSRLASFADS